MKEKKHNSNQQSPQTPELDTGSVSFYYQSRELPGAGLDARRRMEVPNMKEKKHNSNQQSPQTPELVLPIEQDSVQILTAAEDVRKQMQEYFPRMLEEDLESDAALRAESLKRASSNLSKASKTIYAVKDELAGRMKDIRQQRKKNMLLSAPANATIDQQEQECDHFAKGLNGYKLLLVCFIGSFFGVIIEMLWCLVSVIIEMLWCLVSRGYIESRAGLVYGPFNLLYGFGAVVLTVTLYKFRNRGAWISFLGGIIVGSVVEYVCSWGQELVFGTRSWDYSKMPFNINGRICLLYSIFWVDLLLGRHHCGQRGGVCLLLGAGAGIRHPLLGLQQNAL